MTAADGATKVRPEVPPVRHEAYSFTCLDCGRSWEQEYDVSRYVDGEGVSRVRCTFSEGKLIRSPLTHPYCPSCESTVLRVPPAGGDIEVVAEAVSGDEALEVVAAHDPDGVVLDLAMPDGLDGYLLKTAAGEQMRAAVQSAVEHRAVLSPAVIATVMDRFAGHHHPAVDETLVAQVGTLSPMELRCVLAVSEGLGNREIAERLSLAEGTVKSHISRALRKFALDNRTQLALLVNDQRGVFLKALGR
ncbi:response regulator transcription factor [Streptomyces sp. TRM66268-LWL]|uniref:Response regulator transcription factor n=1 Tax=Streptomyces polyasparticus TaxID=2767826 RepID=A0ABR7SIQ3_9ACTN|nr:response regulator transcription factor [Streptomyces polyasparticus]MBC9715323.1 response regulator transcription factor [Streptomyces polyasparticus]